MKKMHKRYLGMCIQKELQYKPGRICGISFEIIAGGHEKSFQSGEGCIGTEIVQRETGATLLLLSSVPCDSTVG